MKMKYIGISCLFVCLLLLKNEAFSQASLYRNVLPNGKLKKVYEEAKNNKNEVEMAFSGLFLFYKTFFSSQDLTVCTFTPSCSEYGIMAVKQHGVIKGGVMTMDRLTRCNGLSPQNYELDKKTYLLKDDPTQKDETPLLSIFK
jgi:uncharacterized protein